jgi:hypothetical protein
MGSADKVNVVLFEELFDDGLAECVGDASVVLTPAGLTLLRIGPKQVAKQTVLGNLSRPCDLLQLSYSDKFGRETSVHAENLVIDEGRNGHAIENILELFPDADWVAALALIVEAIDSIDLSALVVTAQQEEVLLEFDLVREQKNDCLQRILSTIDIVSKEEIIGFWGEAAIFK